MSKARNALQLFDTAIHGLEEIQALTKIGGDSAQKALHAIDAIVEAIMTGFEHSSDPATVRAAMDKAKQSLRDRIAANDTEIDRLAREKFKGEGNPE